MNIEKRVACKAVAAYSMPHGVSKSNPEKGRAKRSSINMYQLNQNHNRMIEAAGKAKVRQTTTRPAAT